MKITHDPTHFLFFTGKGGVGKTSLSTAVALKLSDAGKKVLLVSTDSASNLDEMLGVELKNTPVLVPMTKTLYVLNIDPDNAAESYRRRVIAQMDQGATEKEIIHVREELSGACTTEIAAFDEFAGLLGDEAKTYDHVIFDTAPTGHTLRLLSLPKAWSGFLVDNDRGASCLGPHSGLKMQEDRFKAALNSLTNPKLTTIVLVTRAEKGAIEEAARTSDELRNLNLNNQHLIINGVFKATNSNDLVAKSIEELGQKALNEMPLLLKKLEIDKIPLRSFDTVGLDALRELLNENPEKKFAENKTINSASEAYPDPAAHVTGTLGGDLKNLKVDKIDSQVETQKYIEKILQTKGAKLNAEEKALMIEDLRSPCTEEVAAFHAFSKIVSEAQSSFVVLDTAPTGHSLLLMDAAGAYHRQTLRDLEKVGITKIKTPLMRLQNPDYTKIILVSWPEATPVSQAAALQEDLRRAKIEPFAWVINKSILASGTKDELLNARMVSEEKQMSRIERGLAQKIFVLPWRPTPPVGIDELSKLV